MAYKPSFGGIAAGGGPAGEAKAFRIAILGDWTGRANRGVLASAEEIAGAKPIKVDFDSLESVFAKLEIGLRLPLAGKTSVAELKFPTWDDLHPDAIVRQVPYFEDLTGFPRRLSKQQTYDKLAPKILQWAAAHGDLTFDPPASRATAVPQAESLEEYTTAEPKPTVPAKRQPAEPMDVVHRVLGPCVKRILEGREPDQKLILEAAAEACNEGLRQVLHHPDLEALESNWRGLEWLLRRVAKGGGVDVFLIDLSAQEFAADLSRNEQLDDSGLFQLLVQKTSGAVDGDPWALLVGLYDFDVIAPHAELLGRMSKLAARVHAPFLSAITPKLLDENFEVDPEAGAVWSELRAAPESGYLGLALPKFLLRTPYGAKTSALESFEFEEFSADQPTRYCCWGNSALACAALLATGYQKAQGWNYRPGSDLVVEKMPMHVYRDADDEPVSILTQTRFTAAISTEVAKLGMSPLLAIRDRDAVQFGALRSLSAQSDALVGRWGQKGGTPPAQAAPRETVTVGASFGMPGDPPEKSSRPASPAPAVQDDDDGVSAGSSPPAAESIDDGMDPELAALLGGGDDASSSSASETPATTGAGDDFAMDPELAALLAGSDESPSPADAVDAGIDPELAALLGEDSANESPAATGDDLEMDPELAALLADIDEAPSAPPVDEGIDPELAALLGDSTGEESPSPAGDDMELDPELAALLNGTGEQSSEAKPDDDDDDDDGMDPELAALLRGE